MLNTKAIPVVCAWCPDFDRSASAGVSHGICPTCHERMIFELMKLPTRVTRAHEVNR